MGWFPGVRGGMWNWSLCLPNSNCPLVMMDSLIGDAYGRSLVTLPPTLSKYSWTNLVGVQGQHSLEIFFLAFFVAFCAESLCLVIRFCVGCNSGHTLYSFLNIVKSLQLHGCRQIAEPRKYCLVRVIIFFLWRFFCFSIFVSHRLGISV